MPTKPGNKRLEVDLTDEELEKLKQLARKRGLTRPRLYGKLIRVGYEEETGQAFDADLPI